jgi:hypothetical protein
MTTAIDRSPLPTGMRAHLLAILDLGYPSDAQQTRLGTAPDAAIAWMAQSMLDDYADYAAFANDNEPEGPDPDDDRMTGGWRGLEA